MLESEEPPVIKTFNFSTFFSDNQLGNMKYEPVPLSLLHLNYLDFKDKECALLSQFTYPQAWSSTADKTEFYLAKIIDTGIYFYVIDDEGMSGYDCCGSMILRYCSSWDTLHENTEMYRVTRYDIYGDEDVEYPEFPV